MLLLLVVGGVVVVDTVIVVVVVGVVVVIVVGVGVFVAVYSLLVAGSWQPVVGCWQLLGCRLLDVGWLAVVVMELTVAAASGPGLTEIRN